VFISGIEGFTTIIRNTSTFNSKNFSLLEVKLCCVIAPECDLNLQSSFINQLKSAFVFRWTDTSVVTFRLERRNKTYCKYDSCKINSSLLLKVIDIFNCHKRKPLIFNSLIIFYSLDDRITIENDSIIIFNRSVFWICDLNISPTECVNLTFIQLCIISLSAIIKECAYNLSPFIVHKLNIKYGALSFSVFPRSLCMFLCHTRLDLPIKVECVKSLNWSIMNLVNITNNFVDWLADLRIGDNGARFTFFLNNILGVWLRNNGWLDNNNRFTLNL